MEIANLQTKPQAGQAAGIADRVRFGPSIECAAVFLLSLGLMLWIQFASPAIVGNDAYYHIQWSRMLRASLPHLPVFTWLPLTVLRASDFVDQHFLFHVMLIPFTFGDLRLGAKLAAPFYSAIAFTSIFGLLVVYRIRYRWLWLIPLFAGSEPFLYRMSMTRAPSFSLVILAAGTYLILERRFYLLALLSFVFVWQYNMFPLIVAFAFAYAVSVWPAERRIDLGAIYATLTGVVLGLLINPYFPKDFLLIFHHAHMLLAEKVSIDVGTEWYPLETWEMLTGNAVAIVFSLLALLIFDFRKRARDVRPLFLMLVSAGLLLMALRWRRFFEYWPPFGVLFAVFTFEAEGIEWPDLGSARLALGVGVAVLCAAAVVNVRGARAEIRDIRDPFAMQGASAWLAEHTPANTIVFNADWAEFPELFYYNRHNVYVTGLDPRYLYDAQPELWKIYDSMDQGQEQHPGKKIREQFGADYAVARTDSTDFLDAAKASGEFETVYSDAYALVLRVR